MKQLLLLMVLLGGLMHAQTYESNVTTHWFTETGDPVDEIMKRDITRGRDYIVVTSYGKQGTDIQKWVVLDESTIVVNGRQMVLIPTYLDSGEPGEYPATFSFYYDKKKKVNFITCAIPSTSYASLPEGAPIMTRFYIHNAYPN